MSSPEAGTTLPTFGMSCRWWLAKLETKGHLSSTPHSAPTARRVATAARDGASPYGILRADKRWLGSRTHRNAVDHVEFGREGSPFVVGGDGTARLWDFPLRHRADRFKTRGILRKAIFSPDGESS